MSNFELKIFMEENTYDAYVGGSIVVLCNGINITKHDESKSESIVSDYYINFFEILLRSMYDIIKTENEIRCPLMESPFDFKFKRKGNLVDVVLQYKDAIDGWNEPIAVPLGDFTREILDKANYFINYMLAKNPNIIDETEFQDIVKAKEKSEKAWFEYSRS